ncbi:MAG: hypothetical protein OXG44_11130 [Gammaproteobacteria bacterium]|nr:hypothetical protein [Gammaproteobacteria bacterium]
MPEKMNSLQTSGTSLPSKRWDKSETVDMVHIAVYSGQRDQIVTEYGEVDVPVLDFLIVVDNQGVVYDVIRDARVFGTLLRHEFDHPPLEGMRSVMVARLIKPGRAYQWGEDDVEHSNPAAWALACEIEQPGFNFDALDTLGEEPF